MCEKDKVYLWPLTVHERCPPIQCFFLLSLSILYKDPGTHTFVEVCLPIHPKKRDATPLFADECFIYQIIRKIEDSRLCACVCVFGSVSYGMAAIHSNYQKSLPPKGKKVGKINKKAPPNAMPSSLGWDVILLCYSCYARYFPFASIEYLLFHPKKDTRYRVRLWICCSLCDAWRHCSEAICVDFNTGAVADCPKWIAAERATFLRSLCPLASRAGNVQCVIFRREANIHPIDRLANVVHAVPPDQGERGKKPWF